MAKYLQISISGPCHEEWGNMAGVQNGRYCESCRKNVIDFTLMSDEELVQFFKNTPNDVCGRMNLEQLNSDILIPTRKIPWLKYFFQITMPAFLLSLKTTAQTHKIKREVHLVPA